MKMKKELGVLDLFAIASGAMISSGLFLLPSILYQKVGPAVILSYLFASFLVIPTVVSKIELGTAMPKAGGDYFYIQRSFGPFMGTFAGFAAWLSLCLKSAFALIGIGIFLGPFVPSSINLSLMVKLIAIGATLFFMFINIISVKMSGRFQVILVLFLLSILGIYVILGLPEINVHRFDPFIPNGWGKVFSGTGMVFVSFAGLTKIVSMAEEVGNPKKDIPRGMLTSYIIVSLLYVTIIFVTIGVLSEPEFLETGIPLSFAAKKFTGTIGYVIVSISAMLAFITTGNAGLMAASRNPMAMAEDNLLPAKFGEINPKYKTPAKSIVATSFIMIVFIGFLNIENLVKVASAMQLLLFIMANISVIMMRESKIASYKPTFKSPWYPYIQIIGSILYFLLIVEMGQLPLILTAIFFGMSSIWYFVYGKDSDAKESALIYVVERLTSKKLRSSKLSNELLNIWQERDDIIEDRFDKIIKESEILDLEESMEMEEFFELVSEKMSKDLDITKEKMYNLLIEREEDTSTIFKEGFAIPHIVLEGENEFKILVVRAKNGIHFKKEDKMVNTTFILAGTKDERNFHLKALMSIAQIVSEEGFQKRWLNAKDVAALRNIILLSNRKRG